ncbi:MAG TPA: arsenite methyltransferase [Flavobacteriales bacterium]|nr:arsenite methyltransferase [Flavobacteriales bacterium]
MSTNQDTKDMVRSTYAEIAKQDKATNASSCCGAGTRSIAAGQIMNEDYSSLEGYVDTADLGLGCGLPTEGAGIRPGHTVLDLGSGAGNDCFVARHAVGAEGRVIGVDFTPEMVVKAKENAQKLGFDNVEFHLGDIEALPLASNTVDVVISNCVLNLVPDKAKAFSEIFRVLKPGGHFSISDVVLEGELPPTIREAAVMYAGCVSGAQQEDAYLGRIHRQGFQQVSVVKKRPIDLPADILATYLSADQIADFRKSGTGIFSITVSATKAAKTLVELSGSGAACTPGGGCC